MQSFPMDLSTITVQDFKDLFSRDFPYASVYPDLPPNETVSDAEIQRAFLEAEMMFNQSMFNGDDRIIKMMFLYLAAYFLVGDIQAAMGAGAPAWAVSARTVGSVSESYSIPPSFLANPTYAMLSRNAYGLKYLMAIIPRTVGNIGVVCGATGP